MARSYGLGLLLLGGCLAGAACRSAAVPQAAEPPAAPAFEPDPRVAWLAEHAIRLRSVSPEDDDFSDLEPLREVLAGARVVLLGEQSHGDGTVFLAKTRLIEFLHREMGFDVLAFESGLYDCAKAWDRLQAEEEAATAVPFCVFPIWSRSAEVQPLIAYLGEQARAGRPLELAGFDDQFTGRASREELVADLRAFLERRGSAAPAGGEWPAFAAMLQRLAENLYQRGTAEGGGVARPSAVEQEGFLGTLEAVRAEAAGWSGEPGAADAAAREAAFWAQMLESIGPSARQQWLFDPASAETPREMLGLRDHQMGRNLVWLANRRYPGRKIVVWAATFHAARHLATIDAPFPKLREMYAGMAAMGEVAWRELGEEMYTLGFTTSEGKYGTCFGEPPETLAAPSPGSLEDLLAQAGLDNAVVDFRRPPAGGEWLRRPLTSRPLGYLEMRADWTQILDGMVYTRTMAPSTPAATPATAPGGGRR